MTPAPAMPPIAVPDGFTVWAASDLHGQLRATDRLLERAGLTDGGERWVAPAGTALVVTGDLVDRGPDSLGLVRRLASLREQAIAAGGLVVILQGNHEMQVLGGLGGEPEIREALMTFGGAATLLSLGMTPGEWEGRPWADVEARARELAPDFLPTLWTFAPYATWGDVLLVHGGPVPDQDPAAYAFSAQRLWIRRDFFDSPDPFPSAPAWAPYRELGIANVVFGHTPVAEPTFYHGGHALNLDTWKGSRVTLARLEPGRPIAEATFLDEPAEPRAVRDAPVTADMILRFDGGLPPVVDAWIEVHAPRG